MNAQRFAVSACVTGLGAGAVLGRSKLLRWGATADEVREALPGDNLVRDPHLTATRAITIRRTAAEVWPWIAQLGQGRGGFYSYDRLEKPDRLRHPQRRPGRRGLAGGSRRPRGPPLPRSGPGSGIGRCAARPRPARRRADGSPAAALRLQLGVRIA